MDNSHDRLSFDPGNEAGERGGGRAKYLEPGLVRGAEILIKRLVMGATVKRVEGP